MGSESLPPPFRHRSDILINLFYVIIHVISFGVISLAGVNEEDRRCVCSEKVPVNQDRQCQYNECWESVPGVEKSRAKNF